MAQAKASQQVKLVSVDNREFVVDEAVACMSNLIKHMMEDLGDSSEPVPLAKVTGDILAKVLDYCEQHKNDPPVEKKDDAEEPVVDRASVEISPWDAEFARMPQEMLFQVILAANYLEIRGLIELTCQTVANMISNKLPEQIRQTFNIKNDFTPEEEEQVKRENAWCEDPR